MQAVHIKDEEVLAHVRHLALMGTLDSDIGTRAFIVLKAIDNKDHAQFVYEANLRAMAYDVLTEIGYATTHYDLEGIRADILNALGVPVKASRN
jgi:hypothetical protein